MNWTKEEILEYNKRCAEFLGYELITPQMRKRPEQWKDNSYWEHKDKANVHTSKKVLGRDGYLSFHSDWNWIMEVVEAIEKLDIYKNKFSSYPFYQGFNLENNTYYSHLQFGEDLHFNGESNNSKKQAVVQAINEFLNWYNNEQRT